jgi:hypothetical protein
MLTNISFPCIKVELILVVIVLAKLINIYPAMKNVENPTDQKAIP